MKNLLKKIVLTLLIVFVSFCMSIAAFAWNDCPKGRECEYPGHCRQYIDTNNNNICDHGESEPSDAAVESSEEVNTGNHSAENSEKPTDADELSSNKADESSRLFRPELLIMAILLIIAIIINKKSKLRYVRVILHIISMACLGFYLGGCICPIGAVQNLPLRLSGVLNGQYLYWLLLVLTPVFVSFVLGRIYCGSVCPMGAVQELLFGIGKKLGFNRGSPGLTRIRWLKYFKYVIMAGLIVFTAITGVNIFCKLDPFIVLFSMTGGFLSLTLLILVLGMSILISRPWCRFVCPYGALLGLVAKPVKTLNKKSSPCIDITKCKKCGLCSKYCPMDAIEHEAVDESECINCGRCKKQCRFGAVK